jgi:hypothetical protein
MASVTIDILTEKLKYVPQNILDEINGYLDSISKTKNIGYKLNQEQQNILDSQLNSDKSKYQDAELLHDSLKNIYAL